MGNVILPMWAQCPALTRMVCVGYPVLSLALMALSSTALGWLVRALFVCNVRSVMSLWLWTLFLGPFFTPIASGMSFLFMLFEIYMVMMYFPHREQELGSSMLLLWALLVNGLVNAVFLLAMLCLGLAYHGTLQGEAYLQASSPGLWPLVMVSLTLRCLGDPQGSTGLWGLVQIPNRWYPICLTALFCLLSGVRILWNFAAALVIGYSYGIMRYERLLPPRARVGRLEDRCCARGGCALLGAPWVPAADASGYPADAAGRGYSDAGGAQLAARGRAVQPSGGGSSGRAAAFEAFSGSGNRLGEASDLAQPLAPAQAPLQAPEAALGQGSREQEEGAPRACHPPQGPGGTP